MNTQEQLLDEMSRLVGAVNRLVETVGGAEDGSGGDMDMSPEPIADEAHQALAPEMASLKAASTERALPHEAAEMATAVAQQEVQLGYEIDRCSGLLTVQNRFNRWVTIPRGQWTAVDVAIDGDGYWRWRCGSSNERSRGAPNFRQRVKRLKVWHSTGSRKITWWCYDLL